MLFYFGIALVGVGALGVVFKTVEFVRVTIPGNYGLNPGFGAYETMTAPWWAAICFGLGVVVSWKAGLALFRSGALRARVCRPALGMAVRRRRARLSLLGATPAAEPASDLA